MKRWTTKNGYKIILVLGGRSNVFLIQAENINILVDTSPARKWKILQKRLEYLNIKHIEYLIISHAHFDHAGNARKIQVKFGAKVLIHESESPYLFKGENIIPSGTNLITSILINLFGKIFFKYSTYESCKTDIKINTFGSLKNIGIDVYFLHTPGHTAGSISVIINNEIALVCDTMFGIFKSSILPPYACDVIQLIESWDKLLKTDCQLFLPSHGSEIKREVVEKEYRRYDKIKDKFLKT